MVRGRLLVVLIVGIMAVAGPIIGPGIARADNDPDPVRFRAVLTPAEEVASACDLSGSEARGAARFVLNRARNAIRYEIVVRKTGELLSILGTPAHIHLAPRGQNGGVVVSLKLAPTNNPRRATGEGVIRAADLTGALAGRPLSALVTEMANGNTYVNVHTVACQSGEARGQIAMVGQ